MVSFESDYTTGAHPAVLRRFVETNEEVQSGYGEDAYTHSAAEKIKKAFGCPDAAVYFLTGGTQANVTVISTMLRPYEGVVTAETGHIHAHEAGALEFTGHKALTLPQHNGKIDAEELSAYLARFDADENREHMVFPGMVYLSQPTEYGTLYSAAELRAIAAICRGRDMRLFVDGARLGYGLCSPQNDVSPAALAEVADAFTVGGTKMGALCGEAVVFKKGSMPPHFANLVKKRGAMLAKGRLLGVQFDALFENDLYFVIGRHAIAMAEKLKAVFAAHGVPFFLPSPTNQQFVILPDAALQKLQASVRCAFWEKPDKSHTVVRFATGWSTKESDIAALDAALGEALP